MEQRELLDSGVIGVGVADGIFDRIMQFTTFNMLR
jgi:hypothetical protein